MIFIRYFKWLYNSICNSVLDEGGLIFLFFLSVGTSIILTPLFIYNLINWYPHWNYWIYLYIIAEGLYLLDERKTYDSKIERFWYTLLEKIVCIIEIIWIFAISTFILKYFDVVKVMIEGIGIIGIIVLIIYLNSLKHRVKTKSRKRRNKK
jgi:hypothetical protein